MYKKNQVFVYYCLFLSEALESTLIFQFQTHSHTHHHEEIFHHKWKPMKMILERRNFVLAFKNKIKINSALTQALTTKKITKNREWEKTVKQQCE